MPRQFIPNNSATRLPIKTLAVLIQEVSVLGNVGGWIDDSDTNLQSINFEHEGNIGETSMEKITIKLRGEHDYTNKSMFITYGYYVSPKDPTLDILGNMLSNNPNCPPINANSYKITRSQFDKENEITTLTGYDWMMELMIPYTPNLDPRIGAFPKTIEAFWTDTFAYGHHPVLKQGMTLPNVTPQIMLQEDPYLNISDITYRDILDDICSVYGMTVSMFGTNLVFKPNKRTNTYTTPNPLSSTTTTNQIDTLTYKDLKKLKLHDSFGPVNTIILGREPQNDNLIYSDVV